MTRKFKLRPEAEETSLKKRISIDNCAPGIVRIGKTTPTVHRRATTIQKVTTTVHRAIEAIGEGGIKPSKIIKAKSTLKSRQPCRNAII